MERQTLSPGKPVSKNTSLNVIEARPNGNTKELTLGTQNLIVAHNILL